MALRPNATLEPTAWSQTRGLPEVALARNVSVCITPLDSSGASLSQGAVGPSTRPGSGESQSDPGCHPGACHRTRGLSVCHQAPVGSWMGPVPPHILFPRCLPPIPLRTHTVHRPVMENADRLTGRRIQAVMREGSQGGGDWGGRTRGSRRRGGGPATLRYFVKTISCPGLVERDRSKSRV